MKILITNDDGYQAPGLRALYEGLSEVADVIVAAPDRERSATSLAITLHDPLRAWPIDHTGMRGFSVNGTPADCVKLAISGLLDGRPDVVFSGINRGSNVGLNANYSGTVAGAIEGAMNGLPSAAISLLSYTSDEFAGAVRAAKHVLARIADTPPQPYEVLNVNVPSLPADRLQGVRITPVSHVVYREVVERRLDAHKRAYYWLGGEWASIQEVEGGDDAATREGYVAITPLRVDWTAHDALRRLREGHWEADWVKRDGHGRP